MSSKEELTKKKSKKENYFFYDFVKVTAAIPALLWQLPKVIRTSDKTKKIKGGALITANHVNFGDPVLLMIAFWRRRIFSLASKDLYDGKFKNWFFTNVHCIQVDKQNFSMNSFHEVLRRLQNDQIVSIFPEGKLNVSEQMDAFKSGATLMAISAKKPIIPVYLERQKKWPQRRTVVIGEPIDPLDYCSKNPSMQEINDFSAILKQKEEELERYFNDLKRGKKNDKK